MSWLILLNPTVLTVGGIVAAVVTIYLTCSPEKEDTEDE